jgi:hypothetical protein
MDDPIVKDIHDTRQRIFKECGGDLNRLIARLKDADSKNKTRRVTLEDVRKRTRSSKAAL